MQPLRCTATALVGSYCCNWGIFLSFLARGDEKRNSDMVSHTS